MRVNIRRPHAKAVLAAAIGSGLMFAPGAFIFQVVQSWVSSYSQLPRDTFMWVVPITISACYILTVALVYSVVMRYSKARNPTTSSAQFRSAVIEYATSLAKQGRDSAVLDIREGVGALFHTQSANKDRIKLGELALSASLREHQTHHQVAILVDDLGWANHMAGDSATAIENINRAIEIVDMSSPDQLTSDLRFLRAKAKRHKAVIESRSDLDYAKALMKDAEADIMEAFPAQSARRDIEIGQIRHAEALIVATHLDILDGRTRIRQDDALTLRLASEALTKVRQAKVVFTGRQSLSKYAKALYLEHCLLNAMGRQLEAREVKTVLDDTLARSVWEVGAVQNNIRGG